MSAIRRAVAYIWANHAMSVVIVIFVNVLIGGLSIALALRGQQPAAFIVAAAPFVVATIGSGPFLMRLEYAERKEVSERILKMFVLIVVGYVLSALTTTANIPAAASGPGFLIAGFIAIVNWSMLVEIFMKIIMALHYDPPKSNPPDSATAET